MGISKVVNTVSSQCRHPDPRFPTSVSLAADFAKKYTPGHGTHKLRSLNVVQVSHIESSASGRHHKGALFGLEQ